MSGEEHGATTAEMSTMRHMLGADSRSPGFRNYGAYEDDDPKLAEMVRKGLVEKADMISGGLRYYFVTPAWCKALGITVAA